jgi:hypothetical protein
MFWLYCGKGVLRIISGGGDEDIGFTVRLPPNPPKGGLILWNKVYFTKDTEQFPL